MNLSFFCPRPSSPHLSAQLRRELWGWTDVFNLRLGSHSE